MEVSTQDFYLSTYLRLKGLELKELRNFEGRKLFVFEDTDEFQKLKKMYYWNEASVDPLEYKKGIRELKGLTMSQNNGEITNLNTCANKNKSMYLVPIEHVNGF